MTEVLAAADAGWLHMDRPTNLMVINCVLLFDQSLDWERLERVIAERLVERYPKFRQRVIDSRLPLFPARWEDDPEFGLEHHLHHVALPAPGDTATLQQLIGELMAVPLDRNRPLWQAIMVDGFGTGTALIVRMHHCIADGISLARVMLSLTDSAPDAGTVGVADDPAQRSASGPLGRVTLPGGGLLTGVARGSSVLARELVHAARSPGYAVSLAGAAQRNASATAKFLLTPADAATPIKGRPGVSRRVAWTGALSLAEVKRVAHDNQTTVNDVLMAAVSGALRSYLQSRGGPAPEIQAVVPFNLRPLDEPVPRELGNRFGLVLVPLPVGVSSASRRLTEMHKRMREMKVSGEGAMAYALISGLGRGPEAVERRFVGWWTGKGTLVLTNVPGPTETIYLAGAPVSTVLIWAPTSGDLALSVSIFSYRGHVTVGVMSDATLVPDPDKIAAETEHQLEQLEKRSAPQRRSRSQSTGTAKRRSRSGAPSQPARVRAPGADGERASR